MKPPDAVWHDASGWRRRAEPGSGSTPIERVGGLGEAVQTWCATDGRLFRFALDSLSPPRFTVRESTIGGVYLTVDREGAGWAVRRTAAGERSRYAESLLDAVREALDELASRTEPNLR